MNHSPAITTIHIQPGAVPPRPLSAEQVAAVRTVMRLFVEDDLAAGVTPDERDVCDACRKERPAAGAIHYDDVYLCNACATEYELARLRGQVRDAGQFVETHDPPATITSIRPRTSR
jgi:hypothetical protein